MKIAVLRDTLRQTVPVWELMPVDWPNMCPRYFTVTDGLVMHFPNLVANARL